MNAIKKYKAYILGVYAFLVLTHFFFKDSVFPLSIVFYGTPLILIICLSLFISLLYYKKKAKFFTLSLSSILLLFYWFSTSFNLPLIKTNDEKSTSVLFWNIAKNEKGFPFDIILEKYNKFQIDLFTFVETDEISEDELIRLKNEFKTYTFQKLNGNMIIGVKGEIESVVFKSEAKAYKFNHITATG